MTDNTNFSVVEYYRTEEGRFDHAWYFEDAEYYLQIHGKCSALEGWRAFLRDYYFNDEHFERDKEQLLEHLIFEGDPEVEVEGLFDRIIEHRISGQGYYTPQRQPKEIINFGEKPKEELKVYFSPERYSLGEVMKRYFNGTYSLRGVKRKHTKTEVARFGHIQEGSLKNFSEALKLNPSRNAKAEYAFICCMYFEVAPFTAREIFHNCKDTDELESYPYIGAALYLFLHHGCYKYKDFMVTVCRVMILKDLELPDVFKDNPNWQEEYAEQKETFQKWYAEIDH